MNEDSEYRISGGRDSKIGPVKARFKGKVHLTDLDPPNGYKFPGGRRRRRRLRERRRDSEPRRKDGGTLLTYNEEAQIGGKLAQLGQRLINGAAKKVADDFFRNFARRGLTKELRP